MICASVRLMVVSLSLLVIDNLKCFIKPETKELRQEVKAPGFLGSLTTIGI